VQSAWFENAQLRVVSPDSSGPSHNSNHIDSHHCRAILWRLLIPWNEQIRHGVIEDAKKLLSLRGTTSETQKDLISDQRPFLQSTLVLENWLLLTMRTVVQEVLLKRITG
jgi:hypothetical protein